MVYITHSMPKHRIDILEAKLDFGIKKNHQQVYWLSACFVNFSISTFDWLTPFEALAAATADSFELFKLSRACTSSVVRLLERTGRNGAGEPAREVRN